MMPAFFDTGFSVREPMWHGEGLVLDDYPIDWADARVKAGLLWEPTIRDLYQLRNFDPALDAPDAETLFKDSTGGERFTKFASAYEMTVDADGKVSELLLPLTNTRLVVRDDTEEPLGTVSEKFSLVSHRQMGEILEAVLGLTNVKFETAGSCRNGAQVWALAYLDEPIKSGGVDDTETYPFIVLLNNHDGSGACKLIATDVRVVCWNTYRAAEAQGERSGRQFIFRHTGDVSARIDEAVQALAGVKDESSEWLALSAELFGIKVDDETFGKFLSDFIPDPVAEVGDVVSQRVKNNVERSRKAFKTLYFDSPTTEAHRGTALGVFDASTEYLDHVRDYRSRDTYMNRTLLRPEPMKARALSLIREHV